jgi:hypothetical protein
LIDSGREKFQFQTQNQLKTKNETHILRREIRGKIQLLLAYFIGEIRVFEVGIFVVEDSRRRRGRRLRCRCSRRRVVEKSLEELDLVLVSPKPLESPERVGLVPGSSKLGFSSCGGK